MKMRLRFYLHKMLKSVYFVHFDLLSRLEVSAHDPTLSSLKKTSPFSIKVPSPYTILCENPAITLPLCTSYDSFNSSILPPLIMSFGGPYPPKQDFLP